MQSADKSRITVMAEILLKSRIEEGTVITKDVIKQCVAEAVQIVSAVDEFVGG